MSVKHFCDACKTEVTQENRFSRHEEYRFTATKTGITFELNIGYASDAPPMTRPTQNNGDLCKTCLHLALGDMVSTYFEEANSDPNEALGFDDVDEEGADEVEEVLGSDLQEVDEEELSDDEYAVDEEEEEA